MAGLQRSAISFRRQGSSGSVWDDKFLAELNKQHQKELQEQENLKQGLPAESQLEQPSKVEIKVEGGRQTPANGFKAVKVVEVEEPPSPKVATCGFCSVFGRSPAKKPASKSSGKST